MQQHKILAASEELNSIPMKISWECIQQINKSIGVIEIHHNNAKWLFVSIMDYVLNNDSCTVRSYVAVRF